MALPNVVTRRKISFDFVDCLATPMVAIDRGSQGEGERERERENEMGNEVEMHGKKIPRAHKLPKVEKKTNKQTHHHIKWAMSLRALPAGVQKGKWRS